MPEARIFLDTNSFIQLRDLADLPFGKLVPEADMIVLLVSPTVIDELDVAKNGTNRRKRDRARAALRLIDRASTCDAFRLPLSDRGVPVVLELADDAAPDWTLFPKLDQSRPDDRLVAETLSHGRNATLLSHDSGPRIRARLAGIAALSPPDDWLLPPEQTDDQRKMASLERDLQQARTAKPQLELRVPAADDGKLLLSRLRLAPLRQPQIAWLAGRLIQQSPQARLEAPPSNTLGLLASYANRTYVTDREVADYERSYQTFASKVRDYFQKLHEKVANRSRLFTIQVEIENIGSISARDLILSANLDGDCFEFAAKEKDGEDNTGGASPPSPPKEPRSERGSTWDSARLAALSAPVQRDPTSFYWLDRPRIGDRALARSCTDFRPERCVRQDLWVYSLENYAARARLTVHLSAENQAALVREVDLATQIVDAGWRDPAVLALLPDDVAALIPHMPDD